MLKKQFSVQYSNKTILDFINATNQGAITSNLIAPLVIVFILHGIISNFILIFWLCVHLLMFVLKIFSKMNILNKIKNSKLDNINLYFNIHMMLIMLTALMYGIIAWICVVYNAPDIKFFMIGTIIIALASGSISTLVIVFISFVGFILFSIVPFIIAMLYHGGTLFNTFAFMASVAFIMYLVYGYKLSISFKKAREVENKFTTIFNKSSDGIAIIKNIREAEYNETIIKMFGYDVDEFFNTQLYYLSPPNQPDGSSSTKKILKQLKIALNNTTTFEWVHIKKNGEEFWVEITLMPMIINDEKVIHGIWRDINDKKIAEKALKELHNTLEQRIKIELEKNSLKDQQMLQQSRLAQMGEMLNMIAHQWRQPLNAISITANNLSFKCIMDDMDKEIFENELSLIDKYSQHLSKTIDDFRSFFKDNKEKELTSLDEIVRSVLDIVRQSLQNNNIKVVTNVACKVKFETYPNEVKQVILNLIKNSEDILLEKEIKNATIIIDTICCNTCTEPILTIRDNAGGVPKEIISKIFDPYFSTKKEKDGTGLGLYMSQTIIQEHCGGKLSVSNDDEGAVFKLEF